MVAGEIGVVFERPCNISIAGATSLTLHVTPPTGANYTITMTADVTNTIAQRITTSADFPNAGTYLVQLVVVFPSDGTYPNGQTLKENIVSITVGPDIT